MTRRIGLSLGADICWPKCFEDILTRWDPALRLGDDTVRFEVERVSIEPFDLRKPVDYDVVIDRLTHWHANTREWIKKAILLDDLYVFNNPWSVQSMEKQTTYCAMMRLGLPVPETWMVPPKEYEETADLEPTLQRYASLFDLESIGEVLGYPLFMKPYDGGGWVGVSKVDDAEELEAAYDTSGKFLMHLQKGVDPWDHFVRCVGVGPQLRVINYDPDAPLHGRYTDTFDHLPASDLAQLRAMTLTINTFFGWDFNSCECLGGDGAWSPIDYANPCPDSQVTSLHRHFPWLVLAKLRWAMFCAATDRPFRKNLDWQPFFDIAATDTDYQDKLEAYGQLAEQHFDTDAFQEFCDEHLGPLEEVAWEYFSSDDAKDAVREKVVALYPDNEVEEFTERFWAAIQTWRDEDSPAALS
ncbi:MAG: hypothetical protein GY724_08610 [Actinomycetia bacterium]|nr:hypothetical protein [Actinomycetes bacterium]